MVNIRKTCLMYWEPANKQVLYTNIIRYNCVMLFSNIPHSSTHPAPPNNGIFVITHGASDILSTSPPMRPTLRGAAHKDAEVYVDDDVLNTGLESGWERIHSPSCITKRTRSPSQVRLIPSSAEALAAALLNARPRSSSSE